TLGKYGGWVTLGLAAGSVIAFVVKFLSEASAYDRFDSCAHEIENVFRDLDDAEAEQHQLDAELQRHGGPVGPRLPQAEEPLAELERILPIPSRRQDVAQEISSAEKRSKQAEEKHAPALANWKSRLRAVGLPETITPENLAAMAGQCGRLADLE